MTRRAIGLGLCIVAIGLATIGTRFGLRAVFGARPPQSAVPSETPVPIHPDYTDLLIPPNIAPLNFVIQETAAGYVVQVHGPNGRAIDVPADDGQVRIPLRPWRALLAANRGGEIWFDIYTADASDRWHRRPRIVNRVADDPIDSHLVYRALRPNYNFFKSIRIEQRNLENHEHAVLLDGRSFRDGCLNCHTFLNQQPQTLVIHVRSRPFGSCVLLGDGGRVEKLDTKWTYTSWHPSGRVAVYSINKVRQFFHSARGEIRDVIDLDSGLFYYRTGDHVVKTNPGLADKQRLESYPTWSPDGRYLYYCSAPILWDDRDHSPPPQYAQLRYDLRRIAYDLETDTWGQPETVLSAEQTGRSILLPRFTPDGRFLVFCMCDYGGFPIYQPDSDLYIMDMQTGTYRKLAANSEAADTWHSFSSNSRWMAFSSRRMGDPFTRTFLCHLDADGNTAKPFVVPREDPTFYDACLDTFSVPELIRGPVTIRRRQWVRAVRGEPDVAVVATTGASPQAGSTATEPYTPATRSDAAR